MHYYSVFKDPALPGANFNLIAAQVGCQSDPRLSHAHSLARLSSARLLTLSAKERTPWSRNRWGGKPTGLEVRSTAKTASCRKIAPSSSPLAKNFSTVCAYDRPRTALSTHQHAVRRIAPSAKFRPLPGVTITPAYFPKTAIWPSFNGQASARHLDYRVQPAPPSQTEGTLVHVAETCALRRRLNYLPGACRRHRLNLGLIGSDVIRFQRYEPHEAEHIVERAAENAFQLKPPD
jgi:hypothetical protein